MPDCTAPEDLIAVLTTVWPPLPFVAIVLLIVALVFGLIEASLRFGFGGVPDGLFGMVALTLTGIALIVWATTWPAGCTGTVVTLGLVLVGVAIVVSAVLLLFWRARRRDGGTMIRGYGGGDNGTY